jgi:hypothetical protein
VLRHLKLILSFSLLFNSSTLWAEFNPYVVIQSVGYLSINKGMSFCNATLIGMDIAITNHHCMREGEKAEEARKKAGKPVLTEQDICNNTTINFTSDGEAISGSYNCEEVISFGSRDEAHSDYTVIRLEGEPGLFHGWIPVIDWDAEKMDNKMTTGVETWRIKYDPPGFKGNDPQININRCFVNVLPEHDNAINIFPKYKGKPCHVQQGNSGGAIINNQGRLIALVASGLPDMQRSNPPTNQFTFETIQGPSIKSIGALFPEIIDFIE